MAGRFDAVAEVRVEVRPPWPFRLAGGSMDGLLRRRGAALQRLLRIDGEPVLVGMVQPARDRVVYAARGPSEADCAAALATAREIARAAGLDPEVYVGIDVASDVPFSDDESLTVVFQRGRPRRPAEVSFVLERLRNERLTRVRVIFAPELRDAMREALIH